MSFYSTVSHLSLLAVTLVPIVSVANPDPVQSQASPKTAIISKVSPASFVTDTPTVATDSTWHPMLGSSLRHGMDTSVSPCDNFYEYANGGWRNMVILDTPVYVARKISTFSDVNIRTRHRLRQLLDSAKGVAQTTDDHNLRVVGEMYASCLAADSLNRFKKITSPYPDSGFTKKKAVHTRADTCYTHTTRLLGEAIGQYYSREILGERPVSRMQGMLSGIRQAVIDRLESNPWMTDDDKSAALNRLSRLHLRVGIPPQKTDYSNLKLGPDYHENVKVIEKFYYINQFQYLSESVRDLWKISLIGANAFYTPAEHAIEVPPVMFSRPFFDDDAEDAVNYGALGHIIGHEIFHSVAKQLPLLEGKELRANVERLQVIHTDQGKLDGWKADGKRTFTEDVADLGGVNVAYAAWKRSIQTSGKSPEAIIDGFTPDQRFFLSVAQVWRSKWQAIPGEGRYDPHGPPFARINGTLKNMPEFAAAFGCTAEEPMVLPAEKRSRIW